MSVQRLPEIMAALRCTPIERQVGIPQNNVEPFFEAVGRAVRDYLDNPHRPKTDAASFQKIGKAALSGKRREMAPAVASLSRESRGRLIDLATQAVSLGPPTLDEIAAAAVRGGRKPTARDIAKRQKPPPRTVGALQRGEPPMPNVDVLVSKLAAALAGATGKSATMGSEGCLSDLEKLAHEVQQTLGEVGHWNVAERVRRHVKERTRLEGNGYEREWPTA